jgi:hypothetical protein
LAEFAARRHGFANSDGGFGIVYPSDLDECDFASGAYIPDGFVEVYGFWGPPDGYEVLVPEAEYLDQLAGVLSAAGYAAQAARVRSLAAQMQMEPDAATDADGD